MQSIGTSDVATAEISYEETVEELESRSQIDPLGNSLIPALLGTQKPNNTNVVRLFPQNL
jgi:hypothetical protein